MLSSVLAVALPILVYFVEPEVAWVLSILIMVLFGLCMAILQSSLAGLAGILPPKYMSAFMLGITLNAVGPLVLRVITLAYFGLLDQVKYFQGALVFFVSNASFLVICGCSIFIVIKQDLIIFNLA